MKNINKVTLLGFVGSDPETRTLNETSKVSKFSLATTRKGFKKQDGTTTPDVTQWHNIIAWRGLAEVAEKYIKKGNKLYVEGEIEYRSYENKDKQKIYVTEIIATDLILLESKEKEQVTNDLPKDFTPTKEDDLPF